MSHLHIVPPRASDAVRDLQRAFDTARAMLADGAERSEVLAMLTRGLRAAFPAQPDSDERLWVRCQTCQDTGWRRILTRPHIYGYADTPAVEPCPCGVRRQMAERAAERGQVGLAANPQRGRR